MDNGFCFVSLFSLSVVSLFVFVYFIIVTIVMSYSSFPLLSILVFWCEIYQRRFQNHVKSLRWSILWKLSTAFSCWQFSQNAQSRTLGRFWILNRIYNVVFQIIISSQKWTSLDHSNRMPIIKNFLNSPHALENNFLIFFFKELSTKFPILFRKKNFFEHVQKNW